MEFHPAVVHDMGCTERELRRYIQTMHKLFPLVAEHSDHALYEVEGGQARIRFAKLPDRVIALARISRMEVELGFSDGVPEVVRKDFVAKFNLYTQRGGG